MSRLRGNLRNLLWLVLVAWIVQLPFAAVHSHHTDSAGLSASSLDAKTQNSGTPDDQHHDTDLCPFCWSLATASAATLSSPQPSLLAPPVFSAPRLVVEAIVAQSTFEVSAFDARGPPRPAPSNVGLG